MSLEKAVLLDVLYWKMRAPRLRWPATTLMRRLILALPLCLTGCGRVETAVTQLSMKPSDWEIRYSYGLPPHPTVASAGWAFSFPAGRDNCVSKRDTNCPSVHYVTTKFTGTINEAAVIHIEGKIEADAAVVWNYRFEKANKCNTPASAHVILQIKNDDLTTSDGRYWSNTGVPLTNGSFTLNIPVTEGNWTNVDGGFNGDGFDHLLKNIGNVGFTFGGGCFFGHGVSVSRDEAKFYLHSFTIE